MIKPLVVPTITSATSTSASVATFSAPTTALTTSIVFTPATTVAPAVTPAPTTALNFTQQHQPVNETYFQMTALNTQNSFETPTILTTQYAAQLIYAS